MDLEKTHKIGQKRDSNSIPRPVIVKLALYNICERYLKVKKLKGKNIRITKNLTWYQMSILNEARERFSFKNVWRYDGQNLYEYNVEEDKSLL